MSPNTFAQAIYAPDCNDPDTHDYACAHPTQAIIDAAHAAGYQYYIGHAEPTARFWSNAGASGNNMQWKFRLPATDPAPNQAGTVVANFELDIAHWISLSLCDPNSYPYGPCTPNSDANTAASAGSAFLELQFFPPGFSGSNTQWSVLHHINTLQDKTPFQVMNCNEPTTAAPVTTNGSPGGPVLFLNNGDTILVTLHDTPSGIEAIVNDLTTATVGSMIASGANGFKHNANQTDCTTAPFDFHAEYMTAAPGNFTAWTSLQANVAFDFEIGHWELCTDAACTTNPDPLEQTSAMACITRRGIGGCTDSDKDHDGTSYSPDWPDGTPGHPAPIIISSPSNNGVGPLSAATPTASLYNQGYKTIAFRTTEATTGTFYPFYSQAGTGAACVFNFGNDIPGTTTNDFGQRTQYGTQIANPCFPATASAPPTISKAFLPAQIPLNATSALTFTIVNPDPAVALTGLGFSDTLPSGLVVVSLATNTCGGAASAVAGSSFISLAGGTLAGGATCNVSVVVRGITAGAKLNVSGNVIADQTLNGNVASATLTVVLPPTISKAFDTGTMAVGGTSVLTFTITNPNVAVALTGVGFSDVLPSGLRVAIPGGLTDSCGGTATAVAGSNSISLSGGTIAANASCTITVNILAVFSGVQVNTTTQVTSTEGGTGNSATASVTVVVPFEISYAANLNAGDAVINISNTGENGAALASGTTAATTGAICANVYAFSPDEQMISCCSCAVTPNGLVSLSARSDLISNTLTPAVPTAIVVKVLATVPVSGSCVGSAASSTTPFAPGMVAWGTSLHAAAVAGTYAVTESRALPASLSNAELNRLKSLCTFIIANGSGFGVCRSCRLGGLGSDKQ